MLPNTLSGILLSNLGAMSLRNKREADQSIARLAEGQTFGWLALSLDERFRCCIDDSKDMVRYNQRKYNDLEFSYRCSFDTLVDQFGNAAPNLFNLIHILLAYSIINKQYDLKLRAPSDPSKSRMPIVLCGKLRNKIQERLDLPIAPGLSKYLTSMALMEPGVLYLQEDIPLPFVYRSTQEFFASGDRDYTGPRVVLL